MHIDNNPFLSKQLAYNKPNELRLANAHLSKLNEEQLLAYESILKSVHHQSSQTFFLNGPTESGKTFVYKMLCYHIYADGQIVLCVASSGITALLLLGSPMAHSTFSIPVDGLCEDSVCNINKNSK